ncbi:MAG: hypothetical protein LH615_08655 [Ferruginibacter sp.]|nr:hypothetical protein [Ferruginibacter sp.]
MSNSAVQAQVEIINKATQIASQSKEAALKFLMDAGIIKQEKKEPETNSVKETQRLG